MARIFGLSVSVGCFYLTYLSWKWIFAAESVWGLLGIFGVAFFFVIGLLIMAISLAPSEEQVKRSASERLAGLKIQALHLGYKLSQNATYSASPFTRKTITRHLAFGHYAGQTTGTMPDTWIVVEADDTHGFFLSDSDWDSEYGIQRIQYASLFLIIDKRNGEEEYFIYESL